MSAALATHDGSLGGGCNLAHSSGSADREGLHEEDSTS